MLCSPKRSTIPLKREQVVFGKRVSLFERVAVSRWWLLRALRIAFA